MPWKVLGVPVKLRAMLLEATAYSSLVAVEKVGHGHTKAKHRFSLADLTDNMLCLEMY